jgi:lipopolysaccharide export system permease protein
VAAVIGGSFSRMGYGKRIAIVGAAAAMVQIVGFGVKAACDNNVWLNPCSTPCRWRRSGGA